MPVFGRVHSEGRPDMGQHPTCCPTRLRASRAVRGAGRADASCCGACARAPQKPTQVFRIGSSAGQGNLVPLTQNGSKEPGCFDPFLFEQLAERGIIVRRCGNFEGLDDTWYRIAVRTAEEDTRFIEALKEEREA